ncbi:hypothetical protein F7725_028581, partial [Dissostichus mawsoni]
SQLIPQWFSDVRLEGKTAIVTGANVGIGKETAKDLAGRGKELISAGARVILACRDMARGEQAARDIMRELKGAKVVARHLDLADTKSICLFAENIYNNEKTLHFLINNAGVAMCPYATTVDGYEMQFGVNHLGHFFLTFLLLDLLKHSAPSRVINLSSLAHNMGKIQFDDLSGDRAYHPVRAYAQSKLANVLFTSELAKRTEGVMAYSVDPGMVNTEITRHLGRPLVAITKTIGFLLKTPAEGAYTSIYCTVTPESQLLTGGYYKSFVTFGPCFLGARIVMACRDLERAEEARTDIMEDTGNENVVIRKLDLSDTKSIRAFAEIINKEEKQVNILINNAGVMMCPYSKTTDGFEMQLGVNHLGNKTKCTGSERFIVIVKSITDNSLKASVSWLYPGHFLLTYLLLDLIKRSAPARIVVVASVAHTWTGLRLDDINSERSYDTMKAYGQSKLANVMFARSLAKQYRVSVFSLHPGVVQSDLWRHQHQCIQVAVKIFRIFTKTTLEGAQTTIYCAVESGLESQSGGYFSDCAPARCSRAASDDETAQKLWEISCNLLGITWQ